MATKLEKRLADLERAIKPRPRLHVEPAPGGLVIMVGDKVIKRIGGIDYDAI
jgi:hypothetical protein